MSLRLVSLLCTLSLFGCAKTVDPFPNKNTNWLRECSTSRTCGKGLSCLCGVCTTACTSVRQCGASGSSAVCEPTSGNALQNQCGARPAEDAVCLAKCSRARDCEIYGSGWECRSAVCAKVASGAPSDAGREASIDAAVDADRLDTAPNGGLAPDASLGARDGGSDSGSNPLDSGSSPDSGSNPCGNMFDKAPGGCVDVLYENQASPTSIAIDSTNLYWTTHQTADRLGNIRDDGKVVAMPLGGGPLVTLADHQPAPQTLMLNDGYAYWLDEAYGDGRTDGAVMRVALSGGTPEVVAGNMLQLRGLAVDDKYAYFVVDTIFSSTDSKRELRRVLKSGSAPAETLLSGAGWPDAMTVSAGMLYWKQSGDGIINGLAVDGSGGVQRITEDRDVMGVMDETLLVDQGVLYWAFTDTNHSGIGSFDLNTNVGDLHGDLTGYSTGFAMDDRFFYWGRATGTRVLSVERTDRRTDDTVEMLPGLSVSELLIAASASDVYVLGTDLGTDPTAFVLRIPK